LPLKVLNTFKGVNKLDSFSIGTMYAAELKNLSGENFPAVKTRPGFLNLGGGIGGKVLGIGVWKETEIHAVFSDGTWRKWNGSSWTTLASGLNTSAPWTFTNFKGALSDINLFGTNGVDQMRRYDGVSVVTVPDAPAGAKYVTQFADRLWCAVGNELKASAYRDGTDWTTVSVPEQDTDSWYAIIETPDGEEINGIHGGLSKLVITKPSSMHELFGYAPSDYEIRPVTFDIGSLNDQSMVTLNGILYMIDSTGIYRYSGGTLPDKYFSKRVQYYIDTMNKSAANQSCIGTDGLRIYISIPSAGASAPDTVLVYDPEHNENEGGTWYVWKDMYPLHFALVQGSLYFGDNTGKVQQITGTDDNGTPISWEWISGPMTAPSLAQIIRWLTAWITVNLPSGSTFNLYLSSQSQGDSDWTLVHSLSSSSDVSSTPIYLQSNAKVDFERYIRFKLAGTGPMTLYELTWDEQYNPLR
jgi:hypothetical protein